MRGVIREEVAVALRDQGSRMTDSLASYLRSGAGTPVPAGPAPDTSTLQDQVKMLFNWGRISDAFQMVRSHSSWLIFVCVCVGSKQAISFSAISRISARRTF